MPQATDLIINNGAASPVAKTFTLITPAAGDGGVAQWALKEGTISTVFPTITAQARTTTNSSRKLRLRVRLPASYTDSVTGLTNVGVAAEVNVDVSVPNDFPEALKNDFVAFVANGVNHALVKSLIRDALPAT